MDPLTIFKNRLRHYTSLTCPSHFRECLAKNPALTLDMVFYDMKTNPKYKDEWKFIHLARTIPVEDLILNGILPTIDTETDTYTETDIYSIPDRTDLDLPDVMFMKITINTILKTHTLVKYNYYRLTKHPNITVEDILAHPELPWDYHNIFTNHHIRYHQLPLITDRIENMIGEYYIYSEEDFHILSHHGATFEQIIKNRKKIPWSIEVLANPHIHKHHFPILLDYFTFNDAYTSPLQISISNPNLTFQDLLELFGDSVFQYAQYCKNFTFDDFLKYKSHPQAIANWYYRDFYRILPLETILAYSGIPWDYREILENNNTLSYEQIVTTSIPDPSLNQWHIKRHLFRNKHISYLDKKRLLEELLQPIEISYNDFEYKGIFQSPLFLEPTLQEIKEHFAKKRIIRIIVEALTNPSYLQCRKRLTREHLILNS